MAELSKTARASMGKVEKKEVVVESLEESIRQIRIDREAKLFVVRMDRIDNLLAAFDREREAVKMLAESTSGLLKRAEIAEAALLQANYELREYLKLGKIAEDLNKISQAFNGQDIMVSATEIEAAQGCGPIMAEIPAQEHDEHHLVDFGHHTTHTHHEGA
jgi:hypothetical protein